MFNKITIGYFADGPWGHNAFKALINDPRITIQFIVPRFDSTDKLLSQFAEEYKLPLIKIKNINSEEFYNTIVYVNRSVTAQLTGRVAVCQPGAYSHANPCSNAFVAIWSEWAISAAAA